MNAAGHHPIGARSAAELRLRRFAVAGLFAAAMLCACVVAIAAQEAPSVPGAPAPTVPSTPGGLAPAAESPPAAHAAAQPGAQATPPLAQGVKPPHEPGLMDAFGHWVEGSVSAAGAGLGAAWHTLSTLGYQAGSAAGDVARGAADAAKGTAAAVGRLPAGRIVAGRERCAKAPNGAPDCQAAVDKICAAQGYSSGTSVDFESAETCRAEAVISGQPRKPTDCTLENFVTKAVCR